MSDYVDLDDTWHRGPGGTRTRGPVIEAYIDTEALDRKCPPPIARGCGAEPGEFCKWPDGRERRTPCRVRYDEPSEPPGASETPAVGKSPAGTPEKPGADE